MKNNRNYMVYIGSLHEQEQLISFLGAPSFKEERK